MELNDSSEKDVDILKRQIGGEYKILIKQSSNDYLTKLKSELMNGFKTYFDELNTKIANELQAQETQQKELHDKISVVCQLSLKTSDTLNTVRICRLRQFFMQTCIGNLIHPCGI